MGHRIAPRRHHEGVRLVLRIPDGKSVARMLYVIEVAMYSPEFPLQQLTGWAIASNQIITLDSTKNHLRSKARTLCALHSLLVYGMTDDSVIVYSNTVLYLEERPQTTYVLGQ